MGARTARQPGQVQRGGRCSQAARVWARQQQVLADEPEVRLVLPGAHANMLVSPRQHSAEPWLVLTNVCELAVGANEPVASDLHPKPDQQSAGEEVRQELQGGGRHGREESKVGQASRAPVEKLGRQELQGEGRRRAEQGTGGHGGEGSTWASRWGSSQQPGAAWTMT